MSFMANVQFGGQYGNFGGGGFGSLPSIHEFRPTAIVPTSTGGDTILQDKRSAWETIAGLGTDIFKTVLGYKLASNQVNNGQYPTAIGQNGNISGTGNVSPFEQGGTGLPFGNGWVLIGVVVLLFVVLLRR